MTTGAERVGRNSTGVTGTRVSLGADDLPRTVGRYVLLKRIARGGMGEVFLATTTGIEGAERPVVVKIIRREHATDPSFIARFLDEARVQAQLLHSGVAQVLDAAIDDATGEPYSVVEFVEGRSLGDVRARAVQTGRSIGWSEGVAIAQSIAEALAHVHERKDAAGRELAIVHRDLSPQNVMVSYTGEIKIIDFGTARGANRRCHTVSGVVFAKPGYVAPEVAGGDPGDARVDVYALGVMLWELVAGRRFLQGDANIHMAAVARNACCPPPVAEDVGAPAELDAVIARLSAHDREARGAARAAARDLAALLAHAPVLPSGERGVRARIASLMQGFFPSEPARGRQEFASLMASSRALRRALSAPKAPAPQPVEPEASAKSESAPTRAIERPAKPEPARAPEEAQPAASATPEEGDMLPGTRYRLCREIGRGSSSVVYEAEHVDLGRRVALKVLDAEHSRSEEFAARFRREARALLTLSHDGLVKVHDFGKTAGGRLFCVMERLDGETLDAFLEREKCVDWRVAFTFADKILRALEAAHAAGVVHRDVKPANVFLTSNPGDVGGGSVKLLDFGLARAPKEIAGEPFASQRVGLSLFGTPEYMAPEQAASGPVDARADLYAVGCVLYEALTGRLPFTGPSPVTILDAKIKGSPERLRDRAPAREIPAAVDELVMRALARHPSVRFQSAAEMRRAVLALLEAPVRRRAGRRVLGFAALAAAMAFGTVLLVGKGREIRASLPSLPWLDRAAIEQPIAPTPPTSGDGTNGPAMVPAIVAAAITPPADVAPETDPALADEGEDGDMVDDTLPNGMPPIAANTASDAPAVPTDAELKPTDVPPAIAAAPAEPPAKPKDALAETKPRKRAKSDPAGHGAAKAKSAPVKTADAKLPAESDPIAKLPPNESASKAATPPENAATDKRGRLPKDEKAGKARHKRKSRVAKVDRTE